MEISKEWMSQMQTSTNWKVILDLWFHTHYTPTVDQLRILLQNLDRDHYQYHWISKEFERRGGRL